MRDLAKLRATRTVGVTHLFMCQDLEDHEDTLSVAVYHSHIVV